MKRRFSKHKKGENEKYPFKDRPQQANAVRAKKGKYQVKRENTHYEKGECINLPEWGWSQKNQLNQPNYAIIIRSILRFYRR